MFFCEGSKVLFRISAALLKKNETALISASTRDFTEMFLEMRSIGRNELDADSLIAMAYKSYSAPSKSRIFPSRSTGNLTNASSKGRADKGKGVRRYGGFNRVPSDLIGMGLAHTGPITRPRVCDVPVLAMSPSTESKGDELQSSVGIERKMGSGSIHGSDSAIGYTLSSDTICTDRSNSDILTAASASPINDSYLSLFRNKSYDQSPPSNSSLSLKFKGISAEAKTNYSADCCFDKSTASAIMQLGISTFNSSSTSTSTSNQNANTIDSGEVEVEGKAVSSPSDASPSSTASISAAVDSPCEVKESVEVEVRSQIIHYSLSATDIDNSSLTKIKKDKVREKEKEKEYRKSASLINMLLSSRPSNIVSLENTDKYRRFKRAEIEKLRADFRPALLERFAALENTRAIRGLQEDGDSKTLPK